MEILAIVPARGGSKGVPRKNLRKIGRQSLLERSIGAARKGVPGIRVIVSTDDHEIAAEAVRCAAEVPFLRPVELARDDTPTLPVLQHVLSELRRQERYAPDLVVVLQPTSPLRRPESVAAGVELLMNSKTTDSVLGVCAEEHPPHWLKVIGTDGYLTDFIEGGSGLTRRQDAPPVYRVNGALYVTRSCWIAEEGRLLGNRVLPLVMSAEESVDVDSELDLTVAEAVWEHRKGGG